MFGKKKKMKETKAANTVQDVSLLTHGEWFDPRNPFALGRKEFDDRYERLVGNAASWRRVAFAMLTLLTVSIVVVLWMAQSIKVIPFIVQVDSHGYEVAVHAVAPSSVTDDRIIMARLADFVLDTRTFYTNPAAMLSLVEKAYATVGPGSVAQRKLNTWFVNNNPFKERREAINVTVESVVRSHPASNVSWQVEWTERTYQDASVTAVHAYKGTFIVDINAPTSMSDILKNPLGVFVTDFDIGEKIVSKSKNAVTSETVSQGEQQQPNGK